MIHAIETSVPANYVLQDEMERTVLEATPEDPSIRSFITKLYVKSGIRKRHSVIRDFHATLGKNPFIPGEPGVEEGPSTLERNAVFVKEAPRMAISASQAVFEKTGKTRPHNITHLVTASCTGFSAPGFDIELSASLGLAPGVSRFHLGFMGCLAVVPALKVAASICIAEPLAKVLVVTAEICSIHYRHRFDSDTLVSNSLFADGAGAALVSADPSDGNGRGFIVRSFSSMLLPESRKDMTWIVGDHGFEMTLAKSVPLRIEEHIGSLLRDTAKKAGVGEDSFSLWAIHPGGRAILDRIAASLGLGRGELSQSYSVLKEHGNMSSATILFILEEMIREGARGMVFGAAFGPGLSAETCVLEAV